MLTIAIHGRIQTGRLQFDRMNDNQINDFIVAILAKFERKDVAFASVSREKRDTLLKRGSNLAIESETPPVGTYRVKFDAVDKVLSSAVISPSRLHTVQ